MTTFTTLNLKEVADKFGNELLKIVALEGNELISIGYGYTTWGDKTPQKSSCGNFLLCVVNTQGMGNHGTVVAVPVTRKGKVAYATFLQGQYPACSFDEVLRLVEATKRVKGSGAVIRTALTNLHEGAWFSTLPTALRDVRPWEKNQGFNLGLSCPKTLVLCRLMEAYKKLS